VLAGIEHDLSAIAALLVGQLLVTRAFPEFRGIGFGQFR
jgi:hypothetical protein